MKSTIEQFLFPKNIPIEIQQQIANIAKSIHFAKREDSSNDTRKEEMMIDNILDTLY